MNYLYENLLACYANDVDAFIPEEWAAETLEILFENIVSLNLVYRDFSNVVANYGDVVHTQKPGEFQVARRSKITTAASLIQDATSTDVQVPLNQWFNQTFVIDPSDMSKSYKDLVNIYLASAVKAIARGVDRVILGHAAAKLLATNAQRAGILNGLTSSTAYDAVVELDKIMNDNKAPEDGRALVMSTSLKSTMLKCDKFVKAMERGDGGQTLATASIGHVLNFDTYMAQNTNSCLTGADITLDAISAAAVAAEAATLTTVSSGVIAKGEFIDVVGNGQPIYATNVSTTTLTLSEHIKYPLLASAVLTQYKKCVVATSRDAGWGEGIELKTITNGKPPQVGQLLALATASDGVTLRATYTVIAVLAASTTTATVLLDRPLDSAITADTTAAYPGPYGSINVALGPKCLALVSRPLAPQAGAGMLTAVRDAYGLGVRVSMQDQINVGRVVAIDLLCGVKMLDTARGAILLG